MFSSFPSNLLPFLIGSPVFTLFGIRGVLTYRRLHSPLSLLFALSGFAAGIAFASWSVPFLFNIDNSTMITVSIFGDFFLYVMFVMQAIIVHYLAFKNRVSLKVILIPTILTAIIGWLAHCYGYIYNGVAVVNNSFDYTLPLLADIAQSILLVNVFLVGVLLAMRIRQQTTPRAKGGLLGIAILYILSGIAGAMNIFLSGSPNQSPIIIASYMIGFLFFVTILLGIRLLNNGKR